MTNSEMVEALRTALAEWDALTLEQQEAELETATDKADAIVRIIEWNAADEHTFVGPMSAIFCTDCGSGRSSHVIK